jgi:hypothetical protein
MAFRYTNTDKWNDSWFSNLKPAEKLVFTYLYENCDIAGFIEINVKRWAIDIGYDKNIIEGALKGLQRGLIYSETKDCLYIRTFLKHQKNLPLNPEKNMAHRGIIKRFEEYKYKFKIENINEFIEGALKGLQSPYGNGISNGLVNGIGNSKKEEMKISEKPEINISFEDFWNMYDKKVGKDKAEKKWLSLSDQERVDAIKYVPDYVRAKADKQFRKDPQTFLNNKCWNDEIIKQGKSEDSVGGRIKRVNELWTAMDKERDYTEPQSF